MRFWVNDLFDFIGRHWGDFVALLIFFTGVVLTVAYGQEKLGEGLIMAALGVLKLRFNSKNGNGNGSKPAA